MNKIITISREFGSGGREIGRRLAEAMKIAYYDQEIVAALIKRTKKAEEYVHYMEKERPLPLLPITTARTFGLPTNYAVTENLNFYMQESKIIQEVAEKSDCVIVGRCAELYCELIDEIMTKYPCGINPLGYRNPLGYNGTNQIKYDDMHDEHGNLKK